MIKLYNRSIKMNNDLLSPSITPRYTLTPEQKTIFSDALRHLAHLDGHVDDDEIAFIRQATQRYGTTDAMDFNADLPEDEILASLKNLNNRRLALELIKELCFLGHADSNLSEEEILFIGHAGTAMGIEIEKIEEISDWVVDKIIWDEKEKLIFEES